MSKKKKGKKDLNLAASMLGADVADDFIVLQPRTAHIVSTVQMLESKISSVPVQYDYSETSVLCDFQEDAVANGKYDKGFDALDRDVINRFVENYTTMVRTGIATKEHHGICKKFLSICKSYYEYDDKCRVVISDTVYDRVMSAYMSVDTNVEPTGIIPKGSRLVQKIDIKYHHLHNNVDKAYAINANDPIPDGVKESDTVEQFLMRVYRAIGLSPNNELAIEISPKIDGVSVNGTISGQMLIDPQTRGDEDQSIAVLGMSGLQVTQIDNDKKFGIQYELFVTKEDSKKAAEILGLDKPYVSCRHAASGILRRLCTGNSVNAEVSELLKCISLYPIESEGLSGSYTDRMAALQNFGIVPEDMVHRTVIKGNLEKLLKSIRALFEYLGTNSMRNQLSYAIDGIVLTVVNDEHQKTIGRIGRTNRYQIALKFDPANAIGVVSHLELDCGKKGYRTPQVYLAETVYLDGVPYDHIPVLSANLFNQLNLRVGSEIRVHRVGDVIPSFTVVKEGVGKKLTLPTTCPKCGKPLVIRAMKLYCPNESCKGNLVGKFTQFFAKLGMDGYGELFSSLLVEEYGCNSLADVLAYALPVEVNSNVPAFKSALMRKFPETLREALAKAEDYEVLGAIGLPGVGPAKAKIILSHCPFDRLTTADYMTLKLAAHKAVGDNCDLLYEALSSGDFLRTIHSLMSFQIHINTDFTKKTRVGHTGGELSDRTVALCKRLGFEVVDSKAFDILITSSMDSTSGKMEAAKKKQLPIYLEKDFIARYRNDVEPVEMPDEVKRSVEQVLLSLSVFAQKRSRSCK